MDARVVATDAKRKDGHEALASARRLFARQTTAHPRCPAARALKQTCSRARMCDIHVDLRPRCVPGWRRGCPERRRATHALSRGMASRQRRRYRKGRWRRRRMPHLGGYSKEGKVRLKSAEPMRHLTGGPASRRGDPAGQRRRWAMPSTSPPLPAGPHTPSHIHARRLVAAPRLAFGRAHPPDLGAPDKTRRRASPAAVPTPNKCLCGRRLPTPLFAHSKKSFTLATSGNSSAALATRNASGAGSRRLPANKGLPRHERQAGPRHALVANLPQD